ncbi:MAG: hypothetical protein R3C11_22435 [Planctomycetaceae bacterium]
MMITISVTGSGDPLPSLVKLAKENDWQLIDYGEDDWIDLINPSREGWWIYSGYKERADINPDKEGEVL